MAVELARQPIKPVNAVQTWREQGDDGEGDNECRNDGRITFACSMFIVFGTERGIRLTDFALAPVLYRWMVF